MLRSLLARLHAAPRTALAFLLVLPLVALLAAGDAQAQTSSGSRKLALVIGNDSYKQATPLRNAREDARAMAEALRSANYQVRLETDLDQRGMLATLRSFRATVNGGDEVVVFYAGHGVQIGAENFLLPVDVRGESEDAVRDEAVPLQRILDDIADRRPRLSMAIIDACRNNPFKPTAGRSIGSARGLAATTAANGQMVIYSAGAGQQALDRLNERDTSKNGLFTRVFVEQMLTPDLPVDRMVRNVRQKVTELAKSVGHEQVPAIYDQLTGDFFFVNSAVRGFAVATPAPTGRPPAPTPAAPAAPGPGAGMADQFELAFWNSVSNSGSAAEFQAYLNRYPNGQFAELARERIRILRGEPVAAARPAPTPTPAPAVRPTTPAPAPVIAAPAPRPVAPVVVAAATPPAPSVTTTPSAAVVGAATHWNARTAVFRIFDPSAGRRELSRVTGRILHDPATGLRIEGTDGLVLDAQGVWKWGTVLPVAIMEPVSAAKFASGQTIRLASTAAPDTSRLMASISKVEPLTHDFGAGPTNLLRVRFFGFGQWSGGTGAGPGHSGEFVVDPATGLLTSLAIRCNDHLANCGPSPFVVGFELDSVR